MRNDEVIQFPALAAGRMPTPTAAPSKAPGTVLNLVKPRENRAAANRLMAKLARATGPVAEVATIRIAGEIGQTTVREVQRQLDAAPFAEELHLNINSHGGSVTSAFELYASIREHPAARKSARVTQTCASAAIVALLAADHRSAAPEAHLLVHWSAVDTLSARPSDRWTASRHLDAADATLAADRAMLELIVERTGGRRDLFAREMSHEKDMPLPAAVFAGLLHEVDGLFAPCDPTWPERCRRQVGMSARMIGAPNFRFSPSYMAACLAAPRFSR
ncbi:hypothetical protein C1D09_003890 [Mesorhizobium intechi]|uniref:ATP-dependent Clp protease proteolytic subunit n=1 Tax=Mesorhizobium intechi TaxID=537601 RepID=A0A8T9AWJ0_9HYPH|nr:ATP-dependent Clp protease proteolytic subunit [Mesorhizobium intechi]TSE13464.1 hypothetical protein C1D09_003890 [Mesorhizobium intechi]